uniref:Uncharacterized protein n=1 Tax=Triticum urartu TaxID=4572 RepID=A0A8R7PD10_TRIUA
RGWARGRHPTGTNITAGEEPPVGIQVVPEAPWPQHTAGRGVGARRGRAGPGHVAPPPPSREPARASPAVPPVAARWGGDWAARSRRDARWGATRLFHRPLSDACVSQMSWYGVG